MTSIAKQKYNLPVEGITCASCVARIERALNKMDGVEEVSVNLATGMARFTLDTQKVNIDNIRTAIDSLGYKLRLKKRLPGDEMNEGLLTRLKVSAALTLPVFIVSMSMELPFLHPFFHGMNTSVNIFLLILTTAVIALPGRHFFIIFWKNLLHLSADMNSLVALGTGAAYIYSIFSMLNGSQHVYFDSTAVIITLILTGKYFEERAKKKTGQEIAKLLELRPKLATVIRNNSEISIPADELVLNDLVIVKPGEKIAGDGIILHGSSAVDESMITGESIPVERHQGDKVIGGTLNRSGAFEFKVTALGDNSVLGQIIRLTEEAQGSKAPIQRLADKISAYFVPAIVAIAMLTFLYWLLAAGTGDISNALINAVAVLLIACPCALGLATPTAIMVASGAAASRGILIKNGEALESACKINTIILDKTGTITHGTPAVKHIEAFGLTEEQLMILAASLESRSEHPLAQAICQYAEDKGLKLFKPQNFQSHTGLGVSAIIDGMEAAAGNEQFIRSISLKWPGSGVHSSEGTSIYVALDKEIKGIIHISDTIKPTSRQAISRLKEMGIKTVMLTGDNKRTAQAVAHEAGLDDFKAEMMPDGKLQLIKEYQLKGDIVAMAGDGINDAPSLTQSDLGIAMGTGTDAAIEAAGITLIKGDLLGVVDAIELSRKTVRTIKENLFWAFIYNIIGIPIAAMGLLNPMLAAMAMSLSSVSVVTNSLRLRRFFNTKKER